MDEQLRRRLAANEMLFREVNEGIERGQWPGEGDTRISFRCECARLGCNLLVELSMAEYEHVRADARRFVMVHGHEVPAVETVVEEHPGYVIVEKRDEAGLRAEAADPRA
jgi:hypothetical protein